MKALTLRHPWPWAITKGKRIENRTWTPGPRELRVGERFALHGGKPPAGPSLVQNHHYGLCWIGKRFGLTPTALGEAIIPGVFAVATYGGSVTTSDDPWFEGPYGWLLQDVLVLPKPISCRGAQGLWDVPFSVASTVEAFLMGVGNG